jgi:pyruvate-formate lyase
MISKIETPEDYQEFIPNEDDEEAPQIRNEMTYIHGVLYLEENPNGHKWVFESLKSAF